MKVWWLGSEKGQGNFGDILTPAILDHFNIKYNFVKHYSEADILCVGSIARRAGNQTKVLGSGIISLEDRLNPNADWLFVRGPYTRDRIKSLGGKCPEIYSDPALLLPSIYKPKINKTHSIGYVPHNVDYTNISNSYNNVINLRTSNFKNVIDKILECDKIISSSLHGIIVAHAYGIPAAWVKPNIKLKGDNIKFKDYFASVGITNFKLSSYNDPYYINPGNFEQKTIEDIFINLSESV